MIHFLLGWFLGAIDFMTSCIFLSIFHFLLGWFVGAIDFLMICMIHFLLGWFVGAIDFMTSCIFLSTLYFLLWCFLGSIDSLTLHISFLTNFYLFCGLLRTCNFLLLLTLSLKIVGFFSFVHCILLIIIIIWFRSCLCNEVMFCFIVILLCEVFDYKMTPHYEKRAKSH